MKLRNCVSLLTLGVVGILVACSRSKRSAGVSNRARKSLDQPDLKDVAVSQDRDEGVVIHGGHGVAEGEKVEAESLLRSIAPGQVVAKEIAVTAPGIESEAKAVNADLDAGVGNNLDAALITPRLHKGVKFDIKNGVVNLTGELRSKTRRARAEKVASSVRKVKQVADKLKIKNPKATSPKGGLRGPGDFKRVSTLKMEE